MISDNPTTEVEINYMEGSISLHIVSNDLEIYSLAKRLDDLSTSFKTVGDQGQKRRIIFLEIDRSLLEKVVRE